MASAVIGALRVNLGIDSAEFSDGLRKVQQSLAGIGKSMTRVGAGLSAAVTAPITAMGVSIVRTAGDFEAAMNRVGAATGAPSGQLEEMTRVARQLGVDTTKSASEAADMMEMLAKNGLSAEQILDGAAASAIALSEATGGDLSRAADVATNVMAQFRLGVNDLPRIVDQITASTLNSQFGFEDYSLALAQAGGVAGGLGVEIEDFNAVVTATADTFNSGSDAGTSFKTFLLSLTPTTSKARAAMENLGLEFFNAQGQMKSMAEIAEELKTGFAGLSDTEIAENMKTIFGTDSMRTAIALMNQGAEGINKVREGILQQGVAAEQQAARMKGFVGEWEKLTGAWEELQIAIASSGILEAVTQIVTKIADFVTKLAETNPEMLKWGSAIAVVGAALGPVILSVGLLVTAVAAIGVPVAAAIAGFTALVAGIVYFKDEIYAAMEAVNAWTVAIVDGMVNGIATLTAKITEFAASIPQMFANVVVQMVDIGAQIIQGLWDGLKSKMTAVKDYLVGSVSGMVDSVKSTLGIQSPSKVMHEVGTNVMQGLSDGMTDMQGGLENTASSIASTISSAFKGVIEGSKTVKEAIQDVLKSLGQMLIDQGFRALTAGLFGGGGGGGLGGIFSSLLGGLFGFAQGGSFQVGGAGGVDSQLVAFKASPNERVTVTKPGQEDGRHGGMQVYVAPSPYFDVRVEEISERTAAPMVRAGMQQANNAVVPTVARYQNDIAGSDYRVA